MPTEGFGNFMSDADALMWAIEDDPLLRSTIVATSFLDRAPDWETVRARLARGVRLIPRMRQRVVEPAFGFGTPGWSDDPNFDLDYHVRRVGNPDPGTDRVVFDLAATAAMRAFDKDRPLWEYVMVDHLPGGRSAFVLKFHHTMTDGVGGIALLLMLLDLEADPGPTGPEPASPALPQFSPVDVARHRLVAHTTTVVDAVRHASPVARGVLDALRADTVGALATGAAVVASAARFLAPAPTPASPLLRARSLGRRVFGLDVPLDDLKRTAKNLGVSLNDVFVGAVSGGLQRFHETAGVRVPELRMIMPINVRGGGGGLGGNHFTPARIMVPTTITDPVARIEEFGRRARLLRSEPAVTMTEQLATALNLLPRRAATLLMGSMFKGADFVSSNVPGAPFPLYLGGAGVTRMYAFGPLSGTAVNVTLLSHEGTCCIGVNVDTASVPDPDQLAADLRSAFGEVLTLA